MTAQGGGLNPTRPYIIGEAGSCHEESLEQAKRLTVIAAEAGCQAIKWQYWSHPKAMQLRRNVSDLSAYTKGSIHGDWFKPLRDAAHFVGLDFLCSVYLPEDVQFVAENVDGLKIASFESLDRVLVKACKATQKPLFISMGMRNNQEVTVGGRVIYMHCVSAYPVPLEQANLAAIWPGQGYSDHTTFTGAGGLAVAAGADYIEVHFRANDTPPSCPDYVVALPPKQLKEYIFYARVAYVMRGSGRKVIQECEREMLKHQVRST